MFIFSKSCSEFEQQHYKSLCTHAINNTRVKRTLNKSTYKAEKGPLSLLVWFLESEAIVLQLQGRNPYIWKMSELRESDASFGSWVQWWVIRFVWMGFLQAGGACLSPYLWQFLSAEPDCTAATKRVWDEKWKWGNEHRHMEKLGRRNQAYVENQVSIKSTF